MATGFTQRFKGKIVGIGDSLFGAGNKAGAQLRPSGNVSVNTTPASSAATNTLQTLMSYALPANAFDVGSRGLAVTAFGTKAGNAAPVVLGLTAGGYSYSAGTSTQSGVSWMMTGTYMRTAASAQVGAFDGLIGSTATAAKVAADTAVDTAAITVSVTATDASAATGNVVCNGLLVEFFN